MMLLEDVAQVLGQETEKYEALLRLLRQERGLIVDGNLQALSELVKRKETLVLELKILQEARLALMTKVSAMYGIPMVELTLFRLADLVPASHATSYRALLNRLAFLATRLVEDNDWNTALLDRSVAYVRGSLSFLTSAVTPVPLYQGDGSVAAQSPPFSTVNSQV
ncbi:flagellar protein FlgN [Candidatus Methylomirabilis sp.]|uniref:flagellar protein FlgN n=1 Tax=Candidatus Methylomirabilis sp. TaxID=2032687 RepID=UPI002A65F9FD|nr:flagellar protein FlgN [Candidatus Methylomirabilis sp.]